MNDTLTAFSDAATTAILSSDYVITDDISSKIESNLSNPPRARLARRRVYNHLVLSNAKLPDGTNVADTPVEAVPWANILQLLIQLLPTFIPLICPNPPTPPKP